MKKILFVFLAMILVLHYGNSQTSEEGTGLDGDNFSLEGAIELFKESKSLKDFEKKLNTEKYNVNNLDLNQDGDIDYIRVEDNMSKDVHAIVLQVPVSKSESQDIAVIEIEKQGNENAVLQIIGDEVLYGEDMIVEPFEEEENGGGKGGPSVDLGTNRIIINVWFWPCVRYVYAPSYSLYVSSYYWAYYPPWWRPWRPYSWSVFYPRTTRYHVRCHRVTTHRVVHAHKVYTPRRTTSVVVTNRSTRIKTNKSLSVGNNRSTKVTDGKAAIGNKTTKAGAVKTADGDVKVGKTTTKKGIVKDADGNVKAGKQTTKVAAKKDADGNVKVGKQTKTKTAGQNAAGTVKAGKKSTSKAGISKKDGGIKAGKKTSTKARAKGKQGSKTGMNKKSSVKAGKSGNKSAVSKKSSVKKGRKRG